MLRVQIRFPLGVYYALSAEAFGRPEWPPSPVRLIGALLAASHEVETVDAAEARTLLGRLCEQEPPEIWAPDIGAFDDPEVDGVTTVAAIRGASRWAPRNHTGAEVKKHGVSPRNLGRERTEVHKGGVAVGDQMVEIRWPNLELDEGEKELLASLAEEVTFLGTTRSPVIVSVTDAGPEADPDPHWRPAPDETLGATQVRVPIPSLLASFDARHDARRATGKKPVQTAGYVPNTAMGATVPYMRSDAYGRLAASRPFDPEHWGDMLILELDSSESELRPKGAAAYLVARAFRDALLGAFGETGSATEAPSVLTGRGSEPHAAIVPLPHVGLIRRYERTEDPTQAKLTDISADGLVRGIALVLPHESHLPDVAEQRSRVEQGLRTFVGDGERRWIDVPGAGRIFLRLPGKGRPLLRTLREDRYREPSKTWETVTPVIHARRRTSTGPRGVERQIAADCAHVGLPAPAEFEVLGAPPLAGAPDRLLGARAIPTRWRNSADGPTSHLRLTFDQPIVGPVLLGRGRHFGTGLMLPVAGAPEESPTGVEPEASR